jgi:hypothetical protein
VPGKRDWSIWIPLGLGDPGANFEMEKNKVVIDVPQIDDDD